MAKASLGFNWGKITPPTILSAQYVTGISYLFIHLLAFSLPGWMITRLFGFQSARLVFVVASAYIYYALLAIGSKWFDLSLVNFYSAYIALLFAITLVAFVFRPVNISPPIDRHWLVGLLIVVIGYSIYRYIVGPYTEIPADLYRHLEYARIQFDAMAEGHLGSQHDIQAILKQKGGIWYSFYALITLLTGLEFSQTFPWATFANSLVFLAVVFSFAWYIFERLCQSPSSRLFAALLATFFTASHMGINVFSYLRYYSFAPTMLNMTIYFASLIAILELFKWQSQQVAYSIFLLLGLFAGIAIHMQEALFILCMGAMMLLWYALLPKRFALRLDRYFPVHKLWLYRLLLALLLLGFAALVIWSYMHLGRPNSFFHKVIPLSNQFSLLKRILFINPTYQGIQVITIWGLAVYLVFIVYWRKFIQHPYLFAGMLLPLATVFNPVFVDWFLRLDGVHTLWRMLYIVPIHFVAALSVVFLTSSATTFSQWWKKGMAYMMIIGLFALLLPIPGVNPNSRLTLAPIDADEGYSYWQDLIDYLNQEELKPTTLLTDPVTGYVLNGLSKHRSYQYKFFRKYMRQINFQSYENAPLKQYKGWLLVINDRNGGYSETGDYALHWRGDILQTADFYSKPLRTHIDNNPEDRFKLLWEANKIRVYRIQ
jgi:hypothetical protein